MSWNPRYVLWAKKHKLTPEEMIEKDHADWPGGCMVGFSLWIEEEVKNVCLANGCGDKNYDLRNLIGRPGVVDFQKTFDQWLESRVS